VVLRRLPGDAHRTLPVLRAPGGQRAGMAARVLVRARQADEKVCRNV